MAFELVQGISRDNVPVPVSGIRLRGLDPVAHTQLDDCIQRLDRLVMGDVLLGLPGLDVGQRKMDGVLRHWSPARIHKLAPENRRST